MPTIKSWNYTTLHVQKSRLDPRILQLVNCELLENVFANPAFAQKCGDYNTKCVNAAADIRALNALKREVWFPHPKKNKKKKHEITLPVQKWEPAIFWRNSLYLSSRPWRHFTYHQ